MPFEFFCVFQKGRVFVIILQACFYLDVLSVALASMPILGRNVAGGVALARTPILGRFVRAFGVLRTQTVHCSRQTQTYEYKDSDVRIYGRYKLYVAQDKHKRANIRTGHTNIRTGHTNRRTGVHKLGTTHTKIRTNKYIIYTLVMGLSEAGAAACIAV